MASEARGVMQCVRERVKWGGEPTERHGDAVRVACCSLLSLVTRQGQKYCKREEAQRSPLYVKLQMLSVLIGLIAGDVLRDFSVSLWLVIDWAHDKIQQQKNLKTRPDTRLLLME